MLVYYLRVTCDMAFKIFFSGKKLRKSLFDGVKKVLNKIEVTQRPLGHCGSLNMPFSEIKLTQCNKMEVTAKPPLLTKESECMKFKFPDPTKKHLGIINYYDYRKFAPSNPLMSRSTLAGVKKE